MKVLTSLSIIGLSILFFLGFIFHYHFTLGDVASLSFYENLANPSVRIVRIPEGVRQEQVVATVGEELGWSDAQKKDFSDAHLAFGMPSLEGYYFPKTYLINKDSDPLAVTATMYHAFNDATKDIPKSKTTTVINQDTVLKIASIIQRESGGKSDMRLISGIIWNRIFKGMKLQMDATLQYVKGDEDNWWPQVTSNDKKIESPYNTYIHADLPPTPISNAGVAAISAAYNPLKTSCLFYLHDKKGNIHCSTTYAGHLQNIAKYY